MTMESTWLRVLQLLKIEIKESSYEKWFSTIEEVYRRGNTILIPVSDPYAKSYMQQSFTDAVRQCFRLVCGEDLAVDFILENQLAEHLGVPLPEAKNNRYGEEPLSESILRTPFRFNPRYTFDTFVVGGSNRFAHAAAMAVAERPSRTYNPLFIYGGSGLGKTHLMHAIAQSILEKDPKQNVVYVSTESFTNEFISLVRMGKVYAFKNRYRNADVFLIDDIQFLTGKEETQGEFFHTFNTLHEAGKQIIISSDRPPKEIKMLEERLRSRFEWGLITDIQPPDLETRCAILQRKAFIENALIPDEVIFYIADKIHSNIRELEGALNKVIHYAMINQIEDLQVEHAIDALKGILPDERKEPLKIEDVQKAVAEYFQLSIADLKSKKRDRYIAYPRQIAMFLCRDLLDTRLAKIGEDFGNRDHTTVIHACEKINQSLEKDKELNRAIKNIKEILQA